MTWREIKEAVEKAGVGENEEINLIQCENGEAITRSTKLDWEGC